MPLVLNPLTGRMIDSFGKVAIKLLAMHKSKQIKLDKKTIRVLSGGSPDVVPIPKDLVLQIAKGAQAVIPYDVLCKIKEIHFNIQPNDKNKLRIGLLNKTYTINEKTIADFSDVFKEMPIHNRLETIKTVFPDSLVYATPSQSVNTHALHVLLAGNINEDPIFRAGLDIDVKYGSLYTPKSMQRIVKNTKHLQIYRDLLIFIIFRHVLLDGSSLFSEICPRIVYELNLVPDFFHGELQSITNPSDGTMQFLDVINLLQSWSIEYLAALRIGYTII
jgi:hypothetical protein